MRQNIASVRKTYDKKTPHLAFHDKFICWLVDMFLIGWQCSRGVCFTFYNRNENSTNEFFTQAQTKCSCTFNWFVYVVMCELNGAAFNKLILK